VTNHWTDLGERSSASISYLDEPDGLPAVMSARRGVVEKAAVERFEMVLAAGQSAAFCIPRAPGEAPEPVALTNAGRSPYRRAPAAVSAQ
jgi:hypothetical protein